MELKNTVRVLIILYQNDKGMDGIEAAGGDLILTWTHLHLALFYLFT